MLTGLELYMKLCSLTFFKGLVKGVFWKLDGWNCVFLCDLLYPYTLLGKNSSTKLLSILQNATRTLILIHLNIYRIGSNWSAFNSVIEAISKIWMLTGLELDMKCCSLYYLVCVVRFWSFVLHSLGHNFQEGENFIMI